MSGTIVTAITAISCTDSSLATLLQSSVCLLFKALYLVLQLGSFLFSALSNLPYILLQTCQIQWRKKRKKNAGNLTRLHTHKAWILYLLFPQEKAFCCNLMTDIQSLKYICLWLPLNVTHQAEETLCGGMRGLFVCFPKWL